MAGQKILVIDDSGVIRRTVKDMLPAGNFEVLEAKDGVEGLNLIRQQHPNLIMLDFILPKMSGWDVFQHIQVQPELQKIPLVVMSGRKEEVTQKIKEPFEYFEFIEKPFDKKVLVDAIKSAMVKAKKPRQQVAPAVATTPAAATTPSSASEPVTSNATSAEIQQLNQKIAKMQGEIDNLKKQLAQVVGLIKQKLK
ncbi:response regulator receiver protein [Crinalium epipsammum PCC 9333]|uniref:Response regulator receiver protein n=1 Tax=Crinalium epipsammum PCC 9333 TaxID=1173022 RepID=K9VY86_9CYAN|nr:response regulator [Crinalium epipsammum]AFZ12105.1 response regulator receiver protein [Crinalium epipsammum PCC 9333]